MAFDLTRWLDEFPVRSHCLYLNHAAVAPLPRRVAEAMRSRIAEQETRGSRLWQQWQQTELSVRSLTGELTGCRGDDVSIVRSTSEGLSLIASGFPWKKGDAVLVGAEEFAANVAPYLALRRRGVAVKRFRTPSGRIFLDEVVPLLKPPVKMLALSWVAFHTGWVAPVAELAKIAHDNGIVVVLDAIQGLGALAEGIDDLGVDAMVADGHKWLLAPEGVGIMVTRPELRESLDPVLAGWLNVKLQPHDMFLHELNFHQDGRRFEPGAQPTILIAGLAAALDLLLEVGLGEIEARVVANSRTLTHLLLDAGWQVGSPGSAHPIAGIVAGRHPFLPSHEVAKRLAEHNIEVTARQGWVRFAPHFYITTGELEALRGIFKKL